VSKAKPANDGAGNATSARLKPRGSNQLGVRQFNERVVLQAIRLHGEPSKAELARLTGLTAQTIGLITARLDAEKLLLRQDKVRGRIGQPSVPIALNPDGAFAIGINIGRRGTDCLLVDFACKVRKRLGLQYPFPDAEVLLPAINEHMKRLKGSLGRDAERLIGVGVATPFQMGGWHRMLNLSQAQADAWNHLDIAAAIQSMTALPVSYAKDTAAACVAELIQGQGRQIKSYLYLFVDTFVGGGLVLNSQLHGGIHGNAGAVASMPLRPATDNAVPEQLVRAASLWELEQKFAESDIDPRAAYDERAMDAPWRDLAQAWTASAAIALAQCIVSGTAIVDVEAVVLDGSMTPALRQALFDQTCLAMQRYNWEGLWPPEMHMGTIGPDARAIGGALLPLHLNFAPDSEVFLKGD
jgi:predicted NBD/HSP70 family sugar kinase